MQHGIAALAAAAAVAVLAAFAPAASADHGHFTYMLCANPDTGQGTMSQDGAFPDGVSMRAGHINMTTLQAHQACSGQVNGGRGMIIKPLGSYGLAQSAGTAFEFRAPDGVRFVDADVWRRTNTTNGLVSLFQRTSDDWQYASPSWDNCEQPGWGCNGRGSFDAFGPGNHAYVGQAHNNMPNGFKWQLKCAWFGCNVTNDNAFAVYGGKVHLADDAAPGGSLGVGGLASDSVLQGVEEASFTGTDGQSGIYRARLLVDGQAQPWFVVDGGSATCRDSNPSNGNPYEFGRTRPCPGAANGTASLDTGALGDGVHNVRLVVEDAGGRSATLMNRDVTVDNVKPPVAAVDPVVSGEARDGRTLVAQPAVWDDDGAEGDPEVVRRWQRCNASGDACVDLPATVGDSLTLDDGDVDRRFRLVETASNGEGSSVAASSLTEVVVDTPAPRSVAAPSVLGFTRRGNVLLARSGGWDDHGADGEPSVTRQWQRCSYSGGGCADVAGAVGETFTLGDADLNRRIVLVETASNAEGGARATSAATARVTREDGTLPPNNDGEDNDNDGDVDEPDEPSGGGGGIPGTGTNGVGGTPVPPGEPGRPGVDGRTGTSGSSSTTSSSHSTSSRTSVVGLNGAGASPHARLSVGFRDSSARSLRVRYGRGAVVEGRLVDEVGRPIRGALIDVGALPSGRAARSVALPGVSTGEDGRFVFAVARNASSSSLRFGYAVTRGEAPVAVDKLSLRVVAAVRLAVKLRGTLVRYTGRVLSRPLPAAGKLVILQGRVPGRAWQTFASRRARRNGTFAGRYRLKVRNPGRRLQFRARVVAESGFPFLPAASRAVTRTVR